MHYKILFSIVSFVLIFAITSTERVFGYADDDVEILVSVEKSSYKVGDLLTIEGTGAHSYTVFAEIISPSGDQITELKLTPKSNGDFLTVWIIPQGLDDGTYTIQVRDTKKQTQTTFNIGTATQLQNLPQNQDTKVEIPDWIKQIAKFWSDGDISDEEFAAAIEYLIQSRIITSDRLSVVDEDVNSEAQLTEQKQEIKIPTWIRNNAKWFADGSIGSSAFALGLEYMVEEEIIKSPKIKVAKPNTAPILDQDGDDIPDASDSCPTQPETLNGFEDSDGCPDTEPGILSVSNGTPFYNNKGWSNIGGTLSWEYDVDFDDKGGGFPENGKFVVEISGFIFKGNEEAIWDGSKFKGEIDINEPRTDGGIIYITIVAVTGDSRGIYLGDGDQLEYVIPNAT